MSENNSHANRDSVRSAIRRVIAHYKAHFAQTNENERYKWEAIGWYKRHWNIDAEDFPAMLSEAFSQAQNLLASGMYYPCKMIVEYARANPEEVRHIFRLLHNEDLPFAQRYGSMYMSADDFTVAEKTMETEISQEDPTRNQSADESSTTDVGLNTILYGPPGKVLSIANDFNSQLAQSSIYSANGLRYVVDGHHTTVASIIAGIGTTMNMGLPTTQLPSAQDFYWWKHWWEFWKKSIKLIK